MAQDLPDLRERFFVSGRFAHGVSRAAFDVVHSESSARLYLHVAAIDDGAAKYALQYACSQLAVVEHPFFPTVHACGRGSLDERDVCFAATDRLRGEALSGRVLDEEEGRELLIHALHGVEVLHRSGSAHGALAGGLQVVAGRLVCGRLPVVGGTPQQDVRDLLGEVAVALRPGSALGHELRTLLLASSLPDSRALANHLRSRHAPVLLRAS